MIKKYLFVIKVLITIFVVILLFGCCESGETEVNNTCVKNTNLKTTAAVKKLKMIKSNVNKCPTTADNLTTSDTCTSIHIFYTGKDYTYYNLQNTMGSLELEPTNINKTICLAMKQNGKICDCYSIADSILKSVYGSGYTLTASDDCNPGYLKKYYDSNNKLTHVAIVLNGGYQLDGNTSWDKQKVSGCLDSNGKERAIGKAQIRTPLSNSSYGGATWYQCYKVSSAK